MKLLFKLFACLAFLTLLLNNIALSQCTENFLLEETFGRVNRSASPHVIDYAYKSGSSKIQAPGEYAMTDNPHNVHGNFESIGDHTGDGQGMMLVFNGGGSKQVFYRREVEGAIPGVQIEVSFAVINVAYGKRPKIEFRILDSDTGELIQSASTSSLVRGVWTEAKFLFNPMSTRKYTFELKNLEDRPDGNDFAIDDIVIRQEFTAVDPIPEGKHFIGSTRADGDNWSLASNWLCDEMPTTDQDIIFIHNDCNYNITSPISWGDITLTAESFTISRRFEQRNGSFIEGNNHELIFDLPNKQEIDIKETRDLHVRMKSGSIRPFLKNSENGLLRFKTLTLEQGIDDRFILQDLTIEIEDSLVWNGGYLRGRGNKKNGPQPGKIIFLATEEAGKVKKASVVVRNDAVDKLKSKTNMYITFEFQQYFKDRKKAWYPLSSPVLGNLSEWVDANETTGRLELASGKLKKWIESSYAGDGNWNAAFEEIQEVNKAFTGQGQAYSVRLKDGAASGSTDSFKFTHTGEKFAAGDVAVEVSKKGDAEKPEKAGVNVIGNPYWHPISWDLIYARDEVKNKFYPTIYMWNGREYMYFQPGINFGSTTRSFFNGYIPAGEGFYVKFLDDQTGTELVLKESDKQHPPSVIPENSASARHLRSAQHNEGSKSKVKAIQLGFSNLTSQKSDNLILAYRESSEEGRDKWDGAKKINAVQGFGTMLNGKHRLAIDTRPLKEKDHEHTYQLISYVQKPSPEVYQIRWERASAIPTSAQCFLIDTKLDSTFELRAGGEGYQFGFREKTQWNRFQLNIKFAVDEVFGKVTDLEGNPIYQQQLKWSGELGEQIFESNKRGEYSSGIQLKESGRLSLKLPEQAISNRIFDLSDQYLLIQHLNGEKSLSFPEQADMTKDQRLDSSDLNELASLAIKEQNSYNWLVHTQEDEPYYQMQDRHQVRSLDFQIAPMGDLDGSWRQASVVQKDVSLTPKIWREDGEWFFSLIFENDLSLKGVQGALTLPQGFQFVEQSFQIEGLRINQNDLFWNELIFNWIELKGQSVAYKKGEELLKLKLEYGDEQTMPAPEAEELMSSVISPLAIDGKGEKCHVLFEALDVSEAQYVLEVPSGEEGVTIYPNPTQGEISIQANEKDCAYQLFSPMGFILMDEKGNGEITIDLSNYPTGVYLLKLQVEGKEYYKRIIKN